VSDYYNGAEEYDALMEMMDDRDDSTDYEYREPAGYCPHGYYVGGCGADYMCQHCEDGVSVEEAASIARMGRTRAIRTRAETSEQMLALLLAKHGAEVGGIIIAKLVQDSTYIANPPSRYGRH
jgi:hypothetical protein